MFMFALLVITLVVAALTDTNEITKSDSDLVIGEQFVDNTLIAQEKSIQTSKK